MLGLEMADVSWEKIDSTILKASHSKEEKDYNRAKGKSLYDFRLNNKIRFFYHDIRSSIILTNGDRLSFSQNIIADCDHQPVVPFIDFRSSSGLTTTKSQLIAFSIQQRLVIEQDADLDQMGTIPAIIRFSGSVTEGYTASLIKASNINFLSMDEISQITLEVWHDLVRVSSEDEERSKRTGTGG